MSEYQYYEFQAIDRPLSQREMQELRALSTRAEITSTSFTNEYHWGDFKGDPYAVLGKYFDAFLYVANWGTHWLMLRLPAGLLDLDAAKEYCVGEGLNIQRKGEYALIDFRSESEEGEGWIEGEGQLAPLIPVRAELMAGDLRALYLGWLVSVATGELDEETVEPPVPPGMRQLSAPLQALADFLRIDAALLDVAAAVDTGAAPTGPTREELGAWLAALPEAEKNDLLLRLVEDTTPLARAEVMRRFRQAWAQTRHPADAAGPARRTVGELRAAWEGREEERRREEAQRRERERRKREREEAAAMARRLDALAPREAAAWDEVEAKIKRTQPKEYDEAIELLRDLRALAERDGRADEAAERLADLRRRHAKKPSFIQRLDRAGLAGTAQT